MRESDTKPSQQHLVKTPPLWYSSPPHSPPALPLPCASVPRLLWRLRQDGGDEIIEPLGVLFWVHRGDLRTGLQIKHSFRHLPLTESQDAHLIFILYLTPELS